MLLSEISPGLLLDWKYVKRADLKLGHAGFFKKLDIIWIKVMSHSETHFFAVEHIAIGI